MTVLVQQVVIISTSPSAGMVASTMSGRTFALMTFRLCLMILMCSALLVSLASILYNSSCNCDSSSGLHLSLVISLPTLVVHYSRK